MGFRRTVLAGLIGFGFIPAAAAEDLALRDGRHWIAVASTQDRDQAIGIARLYGERARVVSSQSGWLAVVLGPVAEPSLAAFTKTWQGWPEIPKDAVFSRGAKYTETLWQPAKGVPVAVEFKDGQPLQQSVGGLTVTATLTRSEDSQQVHLEGRREGAAVFSFDTAKDYYAEYGNTLLLAPLDPATPSPEALVTQNTGGAHCCVATWIATETAPGAWSFITADLLDGGGYWLEDVDGDASFELMSVDNSFLYAFDSYAGSFAPVRIERLRGGRVEEVPRDGAWRARVAQSLGGMEFLARLDPAIARSNGYLAAWVATKIELGQGEEAWDRMLRSFDGASDFGPQVCTTGQKVEDCPAGNLKSIPFPEALADFLRGNGYTPVPAR